MRKSLHWVTWQIKYKEKNMKAAVLLSLLFMRWGENVT